MRGDGILVNHKGLDSTSWTCHKTHTSHIWIWFSFFFNFPPFSIEVLWSQHCVIPLIFLFFVFTLSLNLTCTTVKFWFPTLSFYSLELHTFNELSAVFCLPTWQHYMMQLVFLNKALCGCSIISVMCWFPLWKQCVKRNMKGMHLVWKLHIK